MTKLSIIGIDFETYYEKGKAYSLKNSKYTMFSYIEDEKFKAHMMAVKMKNGPSGVIRGDRIQAFFDKLNPDTTALIAHNMMFDGYIAAHHYGFIPKLYIDTVSLSRYVIGSRSINHSLAAVAAYLELPSKTEGLAQSQDKRDLTDEEYKILSDYARNDAELCEAIATELIKKVDKSIVLPMIDWSIRCYTQPCVMIDDKIAGAAKKEEEDRVVEALNMAGIDPKILSSNPKFKEYLESIGVDVPMKAGKNGFIPAFAKSDKAFTEMMNNHEDAHVRALCKARLTVKSTTVRTRLERYKLAAARKAPIPVAMNYAGAQQTARFSGGDRMNWQNMKKGTALREAVHAPPGYVLTAADSSNIEARVLDTIAGDQKEIAKYRENVDPYSSLASEYYGKEITKESHPRERNLFKVVRLALGYGMGIPVFIETARNWGVEIGQEEAQQLHHFYRATFLHTTNFWKRCDDVLWMIVNGQSGTVDANGLIAVDAERECLVSPTGFEIKYPNLRIQPGNYGRSEFVYDRNGAVVRTWGGSVTENICQHLAGAIINEQIIEMVSPPNNIKIPFMVHDEAVAISKEQDAIQTQDKMVEIMSKPPSWWPDIPLAAEANSGKCYADCK